MKPKKKENASGNRRQFLTTSGAIFMMCFLKPLRGLAAAIEKQPFANGLRDLVKYPGKKALMRISARPIHLETPFKFFKDSVITPNDEFFVRYHLADSPLEVDLASYRLRIKGHVERELNLSLAEIKKLAKPVDLVAVNQCSGNSRGFSKPRVFGAQLGNGSMGNAKWTGIPLSAVLKSAGIKTGGKFVTFNGLDKPVLPSTPDFVKALSIELAMGGEPILAWAMNDVDIPLLNGFPLKLIVPGYYGTYWVKHLSEIEVLNHDFDGFFMSTAYRLPDNDCECLPPGTPASETHPIGKLKVRSFFTNLETGAKLKLKAATTVGGIAFDSGAGIAKVEISNDSGRTWQLAQLGDDLGNYSFRAWTYKFQPIKKGSIELLVKATSRNGESQPISASWNPGGYQRNVIESLRLE
ncbi:MAG: oxidase, partial [Proteobacteria bacterium]